jgi:hypothetical protein
MQVCHIKVVIYAKVKMTCVNGINSYIVVCVLCMTINQS